MEESKKSGYKTIVKNSFKNICSIALFWSGILMIGCGENEPAGTIFEAPVLVNRTSDTAAFEKGISAWPGSSIVPNRGIRLEWHSMNTLPIGGYVIYRTSRIDTSSTQPVDFIKAGTIQAGQNTEDTVFIDQNVSEKVQYYYQIAAFERSGSKVEGKRSETADYTLGSAIEGTTPINGAILTADILPLFRWKVQNGSPGYTVLRVYEVNPINNALRTPVWIYAEYPLFDDPFFRYDQDGKARKLEKGKTYRWYVTQIVPGQRNYGSSSIMQNFTIQ